MPGKRKIVNQLTNTQAAYVAGIVDGEGSIGLAITSRGTKLMQNYYTLRLRVKMCDGNVVRWLVDTVGGLYYSATPRQNPLHKDIYEWSCNGRNAVKVIQQIYPYLIVKKKQADVAFRFGATLCENTRKFPPETVMTREELRKEMTVLNRRGKAEC